MSVTPGEPFATLTHARLRAAQGDVGGAVRILRFVLEAQPGNLEARGLLSDLEGRVTVVHKEIADETAGAVTPATPGDLTRRFRHALGTPGNGSRVERLVRWLERVQRKRSARQIR